MDTTGNRFARAVIVLAGAIVAAVVGYLAFVVLPEGNLAALFGVLLTVGVAFVGVRMARGFATSVFAPYNVARVAVEGPIARRPGGAVPLQPTLTTADDIVDQIERATENEAVRGLLVKLNTPGGEVVPSDDIRRAVEAFDGPTIGYATDTCASGGYWIASGCDHVVAREGSIVGSIGVIASRVTGAGLLDRLGLTYERLVAGDYKDAGAALKDMESEEREYLQGIVDDYYEAFVDRVTDGREELDEASIRETEARVFLGEEALELGLVDDLGDDEVVEEWLEAELGEPVDIVDFVPTRGLAERLRMGAERVAFALGSGMTSVLVDEGDTVSEIRFR